MYIGFNLIWDQCFFNLLVITMLSFLLLTLSVVVAAVCLTMLSFLLLTLQDDFANCPEAGECVWTCSNQTKLMLSLSSHSNPASVYSEFARLSSSTPSPSPSPVIVTSTPSAPLTSTAVAGFPSGSGQGSADGETTQPSGAPSSYFSFLTAIQLLLVAMAAALFMWQSCDWNNVIVS